MLLSWRAEWPSCTSTSNHKSTIELAYSKKLKESSCLLGGPSPSFSYLYSIRQPFKKIKNMPFYVFLLLVSIMYRYSIHLLSAAAAGSTCFAAPLFPPLPPPPRVFSGLLASRSWMNSLQVMGSLLPRGVSVMASAGWQVKFRGGESFRRSWVAMVAARLLLHTVSWSLVCGQRPKRK